MNEKIDWSEAPEGFDAHIDWGDKEGHFYREEPTRYVRQGGYYAIKSDMPIDGVVITRRPSCWNGEGLPPVGAEFERRWVDEERSSWAWGRVIAHGSRRIFYVDRTGDEWSHSPADMQFRAVRSAEQIEYDKKAEWIRAAINELSDSAKQDFLTAGLVLSDLYHAGYRKEEQSK